MHCLLEQPNNFLVQRLARLAGFENKSTSNQQLRAQNGFCQTTPAVELHFGSVAWFALAASRAVGSQAAAWTEGFAEGVVPIAVDSIVLAAAAVAVAAVLPATACAAASAFAAASVVVATAAVATAVVAIAAIAAAVAVAVAAASGKQTTASCLTHHP